MLLLLGERRLEPNKTTAKNDGASSNLFPLEVQPSTFFYVSYNPRKLTQDTYFLLIGFRLAKVRLQFHMHSCLCKAWPDSLDPPWQEVHEDGRGGGGGCLLLHALPTHSGVHSPHYGVHSLPPPPPAGAHPTLSGHRYPCTHCVPALYKVNTRIPIENRIRPSPPYERLQSKQLRTLPHLLPVTHKSIFCTWSPKKMHLLTGGRDQSEGLE